METELTETIILIPTKNKILKSINNCLNIFVMKTFLKRPKEYEITSARYQTTCKIIN